MNKTAMKFAPLSAFLLLALLLTACSPATTTPAPAGTPVEALIASNVVVASAEVIPAQVSEMSFPLSGPVKEILVRAGERVSAGQNLAMLDIPELTGGAAQAEAALQAAAKDVEFYSVPRRQPPIPAKRPWNPPIAGPLQPPERLWLAQAQLTAAQAALETARASLAQATLTAPFDGVVTDIRPMPGEVVGAGQVVIVLANLDQLQIETTDLGEQQIDAIQPGQAASVYIEALDKEFSGQVVRIASRASKEGGDVYFQVTIALDQQPPGMRWGMSAEVQIETE